MSENEPSAAALEWVKGIVDWVSEAPSGETTEEAERQFALRVDAYAAARVAEAVAAERARLAGIARAKHHAHYEMGEAYLKEENYDMAHSCRTLATCYSKVLDWLEEERGA